MIPRVPVRLKFTSCSRSIWSERLRQRLVEVEFDATAHVERRDVALAGFTDGDDLVIVRRLDLERLEDGR